MKLKNPTMLMVGKKHNEIKANVMLNSSDLLRTEMFLRIESEIVCEMHKQRLRLINLGYRPK